MNFEPIGYLQSCYPDKFGTPRQPGLVEKAAASLQIDRKWQPEEALSGLEGFSHVWLIFVFHQNSSARYHAKVHPPRLGGQTMGVFATRTPHRPNPIGLSLVRLNRVESDTLWLDGVDLISGTPILDVKPYLASVEAKPEALLGWTSIADEAPGAEVLWSEKNTNDLGVWARQRGASQAELSLKVNELRQLIEQTLAQDPRPLVYRGYEGRSDEAKFRTVHAVRIYNGDIHFEFISPKQIVVHEIRF